MRSKTAKWFETKVRYEKTMEDGALCKVTEINVVDATSFGEAETRILKELGSYVSGEMEVVGISIPSYNEVFFDDDDVNSDRWYKAKLQFITIDEKTNKEKKSTVYYLVNAGSIKSAIKNIDKVMGGTMVDYNSLSVSETQIMDVFEYKHNQK